VPRVRSMIIENRYMYLFLLVVPREAHFLKSRWAKLVKVFIKLYVCYILGERLEAKGERRGALSLRSITIS
jgi:hypothetical protein